MTKTAFVVKFKKPEGASIRDCENYIRQAVEAWRGQLRPPGSYDEADPGSPMWALDPWTVTVRALKDAKR